MPARTLHFVRLGFPNILEAKPVMQQGRPIGDPRFSANLHIYDGATVQQIKQDIFQVFAEKWPDPTRRPQLPVSPDSPLDAWHNRPGFCRIPLVWGPAEFPNDPNAAGCWVLISSAKVSAPPTVVEMVNGTPVQLVDRTKVYPGAECHASVGIYAYQIQANAPGISAGLNGVAMTGRDLGRFDSRPSVGQMFGSLPAEAPPVPASNGAQLVNQPANQFFDPYQQPQQPPAAPNPAPASYF